jgi:hypothetical protein
MKYTFASLGRLESLGVRIGGAGLGNILIVWATALVYSKRYNLIRIQTTWRTLKFGTFLRKERDKRMYFDLFTGKDGISALKKFYLLNFSNQVKYFSSIDELFEPFKFEHELIKKELFKIINPVHLSKVNSISKKSIAIHVRFGDFGLSDNEVKLRKGSWNYRLPIKWYITLIKKVRLIDENIPIYIYSDAAKSDLSDILSFPNCNLVYFGSSISDMIGLSQSNLLIASGSTFSMWASFLGQNHTIWFPGQMRQKLINKDGIFEGVVDYEDCLPRIIQDMISND